MPVRVPENDSQFEFGYRPFQPVPGPYGAGNVWNEDTIMSQISARGNGATELRINIDVMIRKIR
jgi:hypothetical protein